MVMLEHALAWAARGFRVFPVDANTRGGEGHYPLGAGWTEYATNDPVVIERFWTIWPDANVACLATGFVIADVDVKKGKAGLASMHALGLDDFETLVVRTTTGGYHLYYQGLEDRLIGSHPIADGIDTRSHHAYVIAPGSEIDGKPYTLEVDLPPAPVPEHIAALLHEPRMAPQRPNGNGHHVYSDTPTAVRYAEAFLAERAVAIEGQNGDDWTFKTICQLRDLNLSPEMAFEVLWPWNLRCLPPWSPQELTVKIRNAYTYATGIVGQASPETHFANVSIEPPPPAPDPFVAVHQRHDGKLRRVGPRPWVYEGLLLSGLISTLIGPGGVGKSIITMALAAHLACGKDFLDTQCRYKDGATSIIYNGEDDRDEMDRRLEAICSLYKLDEDKVASRVMLLSEADFPAERPLSLASYDATRRLIVNAEALRDLVHVAKDRQVKLIGFDPLVEMHDGDENNNGEMRYVMKCARWVAKEAKAAVFIGHHTSQTAQLNKQVAGNMYAARGATSIVNASRVALTLSSVAEEDCFLFGIKPDNYRDYLRLDDAKQQFRRVSADARILRWHNVPLSNGKGEVVGVPAPAPELKTSAATMTRDIALQLCAGMLEAGVSVWPLSWAENHLMIMGFGVVNLRDTSFRMVRLPDGSGFNVVKEGSKWNVVML